VYGQPADLTDPGEVRGLVEATVAEFGGLDHLVVSAGGPPRTGFFETPDERWYEAFDLLVMSVVRLIRAAADHLRDGGGTVLAVTSLLVKEAVHTNALSSSVRMAVVGVMKSLAREPAPDVRVNSLLPSGLDTGRTRQGFRDAADRGEHPDAAAAREARLDGIPLDRLGDPATFGDAVAYLCSDRAMFVSGTAIPVDGGASRSTL
jgi:NAD(P)-dependent dehydrogenase (short-subunit alcohol dehydrogenase family)